MPFLTRDWLTYLVRACACERSHDVVVPESRYGLEPLCACWRTEASATLQQAFERGTRKVTEAMKQLRVEILDETHWKRFDSAERLFWNMNTPADYEEAIGMLEAERPAIERSFGKRDEVCSRRIRSRRRRCRRRGQHASAKFILSFATCDKAFDDHVVLNRRELYGDEGADMRDHGPQRRGEIGFAEAHYGISEGRTRAAC